MAVNNNHQLNLLQKLEEKIKQSQSKLSWDPKNHTFTQIENEKDLLVLKILPKEARYLLIYL
jgi:hypothetical protein